LKVLDKYKMTLLGAQLFAPIAPMRRVEQQVLQPKHVIDKVDWFDKLREVRVEKHDLNLLVMDYFVKQGYAEAAEAFQAESRTEPVSIGNKVVRVDLATLASRTAVRDAVHKGDVMRAIQMLDQLDPQILGERPELCFALQQERLVGLIQCAPDDPKPPNPKPLNSKP